jgi:hypothetical protein
MLLLVGNVFSLSSRTAVLTNSSTGAREVYISLMNAVLPCLKSQVKQQQPKGSCMVAVHESAHDWYVIVGWGWRGGGGG